MQMTTRRYLFPRLRKSEVIPPRLRGVQKNFTVTWDVTPCSLVVGTSVWEVPIASIMCPSDEGNLGVKFDHIP
jgi:hypothetical protein